MKSMFVKDDRRIQFSVVLFVILSTVLTFTLLLIYSPSKPEIDWADVVIDLPVPMVSFIMILFFQKSIKYKQAYTILTTGCTLLFISTVENLLDEFIIIYKIYGFSLDDLDWIAACIILIGLYLWVKEFMVEESMIMGLDTKYIDLLARLPIGIAVVKLDGTIVYANSEALELTGYSEKEVIGKNFDVFIVPEQLEATIDEFSHAGVGNVSQYIVQIYDADGNRRTLKFDTIPSLDEEGSINAMIATFMDMTDSVRAREEIQQQERITDLYSSLIRHDITNDIQTLLLYIENIQFEADRMSHGSSEMLSSAYAVASRITNLVRSFGSVKEISERNIVDLITKVSKLAEQSFRGLKVEIHSEEDVSSVMVLAGDLLPMAFENLLRNSYEHIGAGARVSICMRRDDTSIEIVFTDNGTGIPDEVRSQLFQRGASTKGRGLGLYLTKQIIDAYEGEIVLLEKSPTSGAAFRVVLPVA